MTADELQRYLKHTYPQENAHCEWKEMKNLRNSFAGDEKDDVISYVSAIANMEGGHLVIGVRDQTLEIVGTDLSKFNLNQHTAVLKLLEQCTNLSSEGLRIEQFVTEDTCKTVWIVHIPKHLPRRPVYAHKKAWQRVEDSLVEMTVERENAILDEPIFTASDWSAEIVPNASIEDLDELAIAKARLMYKKVHSSSISSEEIDTWSVDELLSNSGIMIDGKLTRAAIILLGKPVSVFKLRPAVVEVTWTLRDKYDEVIDYEHFTTPFILTVDKILAKIRNLTMRELPGGTLFPETMKQYDDYTIREALHNALAHQDYTMQQRINFVENPGSLYYENCGSFIPGSLQKALQTKGPQRHFRNECLCKAMVNFNMIDTVSRGIKKMFNEQWRRHFPMPDYKIDLNNKEVGVKIYGNTINENYTQILKENDSLTLEDCILLDAVQKGRFISSDKVDSLLQRGLLEGNQNDYRISLDIAKRTRQLSVYTRTKGLDKDKLQQMVLQFLQNAGSDGAKREALFDYLKDVLPQNKTKDQQERYLGNLLSDMKSERLISLIGKTWLRRQIDND